MKCGRVDDRCSPVEEGRAPGNVRVARRPAARASSVSEGGGWAQREGGGHGVLEGSKCTSSLTCCYARGCSCGACGRLLLVAAEGRPRAAAIFCLPTVPATRRAGVSGITVSSGSARCRSHARLEWHGCCRARDACDGAWAGARDLCAQTDACAHTQITHLCAQIRHLCARTD